MELQTRKPNRLKNYDYSQNGAYFITICVQDRKAILSQIIVGEGLAPPVLKLLPFGECIKEQINNLEIRYENVKIDNYVIMPNHIHILMRIENQTGGASPSPTVSDIICAFKSLSTLECKKLLPIDILFQRSYHDHIIRDNIDYQQIWQYIDIFDRIGYTINRGILVITVSNWCCQFTDLITSIFYSHKIFILKF